MPIRGGMTWRGDEIIMRKNRAAGRAVIAFAVEVSNETKRVTHVDSGTLRRSVHSAHKGHNGAEDESPAEAMDLPNAEEADVIPRIGHGIEVGSWLPYACVEWIGRGHPGITQGLEAARPKAGPIVRAALRSEGLMG